MQVAVEAVRDAGFTDAALAAQALGADVDELAARVEAHRAAWTLNEAELADPGVASAPLDPVDPAPSAQALEAARAAYESARSAAEVLRRRARDVHACRELLAQAEEDTAAVRAQTRPVIRVADAAAGIGSVNPRRLTLSTYVLRERFESVVVAASRRLERMSSGRFSLERDETVSGAKKAGLGLAVVDQWTGTRRDTRTLSGGESFYASLALALGLADTVRDEAGGVELETLFIDEGFGSLDLEALESVLDVIDALRDGGRVVGIVSHVHELKERIPDRIEVRRRGDGSSTVAVCA
jgi:exonuclease SbcC